MNKIVNHITSLLGILLIPFAAFSFYNLDKVTGWDFMLMIFSAAFLMYVKNNRASTLIKNIFTTKDLKQ